MRKYLHTLVALLLLAALWGGFYFYGKRKAKEAPAKESKEEKIFPMDPGEIQSFTLKPRDGDAFTCARGGSGGWAIVEPEKLPADQSAIGSFLSTLASATVDQTVSPSADGQDLKQFGLDDPQAALKVETNSKPGKFTLLLGDDTPTRDGVYAQVGGNPRVVTLASYLKSSLEKKLFDLRDKRAVTLDLDQLKKIKVFSKTTGYTLVKNPEGIWDLALPPSVRADPFTVDGLVNQLRNLSMRSVVLEKKADTAKFGLRSPTLTVELTGAAATQSLVLGRKDEEKGGNFYAVNSELDPIFTLDSSLAGEFEKQSSDLRDKDLFSFSQFDAKRIEVTTPAGHRVFELEGKDWKQTAPSPKDEPRGKMDDLVSDLRDLRAESFPKSLDLARAGLTQPAYRFNVQFGDKNLTEDVEVSKVKDHFYARRSTDPLPSELTPSALGNIETALKSLPQ